MSIPQPKKIKTNLKLVPLEALQARNQQQTNEIFGTAKQMPKMIKDMQSNKFKKAVRKTNNMFKSLAGASPKAMLLQKFAEALSPITALLKPFISLFGGFVKAFLGGFVKELMPLITPIIRTLTKFIPLASKAGEWVGKFIRWLVGEGGIIEVLKPVGDLFKEIGKSIVWVFDKIFGVIGFIGGGIQKGIESLFNFGKGIINGFIDAINFAIDIINAIIPGEEWDLKKVPRLAKGGIVQGPMPAILGDNPSGKELVLPLERANEFGFNKNEGTDMTETNFLLEKILNKLTTTKRGWI